MAEQVHWGHVTLAATVVVFVMAASAGSSWVAVGGWLGVGVVVAGWSALSIRAWAQRTHLTRRRLAQSGHVGQGSRRGR